MFDFTNDTNENITPPSPSLRDLRVFAAEHANALVNAAALLAAAPGVRTALAALDGLGEPGRLTARTMRTLDQLVDILMLEHVHDPDRFESVCFAALNPSDPVVEEICLLADGLAAALEAYCDEASQPAAREAAA